MVSNKCFVPGCKSGYDSDKKKRKARGEKCPSLFSAPKDEDRLKRWRIAIPRLDREMSSKDKICELHFLPEEISWTYVIKLSDGTERVLESKKPTLVADAVPSISSRLPSYETGTVKEHRKPPCDRPPLAKKTKQSLEIEEVLTTDERLNKFSATVKEHRKRPCDTSVFVKEHRKSLCDRPPLAKKTKQFPKIEEVWTTDERLNKFSFGELLTNITEVLKPNKWWSVSSHEDFLMCVKWDTTFVPERQVIIDSNLCVKVMYYGIVKGTSDNVVQSVEHLSALLRKVDEYLICSGIKHGNKNCSIIMERQWMSPGRQRAWCSACRKPNSKTPLNQKNVTDTNTSDSMNALPIQIKGILPENKVNSL